MDALARFYDYVLRAPWNNCIVDDELSIARGLVRSALSFPFPPVYEAPDLPCPRSILVTYATRAALPDKVLARLRDANPGFEVVFMSDADCVDFLRASYSPWHAERFAAIPDGPIRADFIRMYYLAIHGGYYCDADLVPLGPLPACDEPGIVVPYDARKGRLKYLNPCFIACAPQHPVMQTAVRFHSHVLRTAPYSYWAYSVVHIMSYVNAKMGAPIRRTLTERWPPRRLCDRGLHGCTIVDERTGEALFRVRDADYVPTVGYTARGDARALGWAAWMPRAVVRCVMYFV